MKTKAIVVMAVLAMAFAGLAFLMPSDQSDAATGDYQPVAYIKDTTKGMRAVLYEDKVLMLDLNDMTTVAQYNLYQVKLAPASSTTPAIVNEVAAVNGKIYLDVSGTDMGGTALVTNGANLTITLLEVTGVTQLAQATMVCSTSALALTLKSGQTGDFATAVNLRGATTSIEGASIAAQTLSDRNTAQDLRSSIDATNLVDDNKYLYTLAGWAEPSSSDVILDPVNTYTIEEIIYALDDASGFTQADGIVLWAVYDIASYDVLIQSQGAASASYTASNAYLALNGTLQATQVASASVTDTISCDSFGVLRIQQFSDDSNNAYTYTIVAYATEANATAKSSPLTNGTEYTLTTLANGIYKISGLRQDTWLVVTAAVSTTIDSSGYDFALDYVKNNTYGKASLSLDLFDYKTTASSQIKIDGTYYLINANDSVRTYGSISTYNTFAKATNYNAYVDGALDNNKLDTYNTSYTKGIMTLTAANQMFDLMLVMPDNYYIYAAQGIWDSNGFSTADGTVIETPWGLIA
ncbi:MAG: hypothetical protein E7Z62_05550 [Thermoplasmata archaeon]|nr:hypothetical protein [Thermoplasmata archaeon]